MAILIISIEQEWAQDHHQVPQIGFRLGCLGDMSVRLDTPFWWVQLVLGFFFFISIFFFYLQYLSFFLLPFFSLSPHYVSFLFAALWHPMDMI